MFVTLKNVSWFDSGWHRSGSRGGFLLALSVTLAVCVSAQQPASSDTPVVRPALSAALPDAPSTSLDEQSSSFGGELGRGVLVIGKDELTFVKAPFRKKNLKWDALFVAALVPLIATDEHVVQQVNPAWHDTGIAVSNAILGINVVTAGGIFITGLATDNTHAKETGVATARAVADSVIMYGAMKVVFQRERPFSGGAEGKFFSGNWSNGSFPSGHSMFNWTIASVIAHEYPKWPVELAMYSLATASSTYRVTAGVHFPSDVVAGGVLGFLIGRYVAKQDNHLPGDAPAHPHSKILRVEDAVLSHVTFALQ
jgi:membrane-associated phospholipid phosphatase